MALLPAYARVSAFHAATHKVNYMRQVDKAEDMPFLSPPIRAPLPEKLPVASKDGKFVTGIDGKLSTSLPLPPTIWDRFKISG